MNCQSGRLKNRSVLSNAIGMASVLSTMSFKEALNGWRISFVRKGRKAGSWFNPDTITGSSFAYGRREKKARRGVERICSLSN
jgi:hypothetical protein